jgi:ribonuclease III
MTSKDPLERMRRLHPDYRRAAPDGLAQLGVPAARGPIYELALTHRSFAFEQATPTEHNERLEFLGDAILGAVVTGFLYEVFPDLKEGDLARIRASVVNSRALAQIAMSLGVGDELRLGRGEEASGGRGKDSLLADTFEALIGAVFLDRGDAAVRAALVPLFEPRVRRAADAAAPRYDAKTALQETAVRGSGILPVYRIASTGPDHDKHFTALVYVDRELLGEGEGRTKKEAEQRAAQTALATLEGRASRRPVEIRGRRARAS